MGGLSWSRRVDSNHRPADYEQAASRNVGGCCLLIHDAYIGVTTAYAHGHSSGLFGSILALRSAGVISDRQQGATREFELLRFGSFQLPRTGGSDLIGNPISDRAATGRLSFWTLRPAHVELAGYSRARLELCCERHRVNRVMPVGLLVGGLGTWRRNATPRGTIQSFGTRKVQAGEISSRRELPPG